jgi:hypothetical protein
MRSKDYIDVVKHLCDWMTKGTDAHDANYIAE